MLATCKGKYSFLQAGSNLREENPFHFIPQSNQTLIRRSSYAPFKAITAPSTNLELPKQSCFYEDYGPRPEEKEEEQEHKLYHRGSMEYHLNNISRKRIWPQQLPSIAHRVQFVKSFSLILAQGSAASL